MSIVRELSTDVAVELLASRKGESPHDASRLAEVVLEVHSTLRRLNVEARRKRRGRVTLPEEPPAESAAAARH